MAEADPIQAPADEAVQVLRERVSQLEEELRRLTTQIDSVGRVAAALPPFPNAPGFSADPDGAEAPPCVELESEMSLSPDMVCESVSKCAWFYSRTAHMFLRPYILVGRNLVTVYSGNANITIPSTGTVRYYVHLSHGTSSSPSAELVAPANTPSNTDTDTYIEVAALDPTGQFDGVYSVVAFPIYSY